MRINTLKSQCYLKTQETERAHCSIKTTLKEKMSDTKKLREIKI
jgi:hypothetical protein